MSFDVIGAGKPLTRIGNGGYFAHIVEPGKVEYVKKRSVNFGVLFILVDSLENAMRTFTPAHTLNVARGETRYLRWTYSGAVEEVPPDIAISEMRGMKSWPAASEK